MGRNPQLQPNMWDNRANTARSFGDIAPMSPFGFPNYGAFPQSAHSWHAGRTPKPSNRFVLRPATPREQRRPRTTRNARFARPEPDNRRRPQSTRAPRNNRFQRPHHRRNQTYSGYAIPSSNPSRTMSTSTRLSHL